MATSPPDYKGTSLELIAGNRWRVSQLLLTAHCRWLVNFLYITLSTLKVLGGNSLQCFYFDSFCLLLLKVYEAHFILHKGPLSNVVFLGHLSLFHRSQLFMSCGLWFMRHISSKLKWPPDPRTEKFLLIHMAFSHTTFSRLRGGWMYLFPPNPKFYNT